MKRPARSGLAALISILALAGPGATTAEGNRLVLSCAPLAAPPAEDGPDEAALPSGPAAFTFAPLKIDRDGAGTVEISAPGGGQASGVAASHQGPFAWTNGTVLNTFTVKGTTEDGGVLVLWHRLDQAQTVVPPVGHLTKLICEVS